MKHFGLLGYPLTHTMSPEIHSMLAQALQEELSYQILEIPPQELNTRLPELFALDGFNVTIPYKVEIMGSLDHLDETALHHGAVNVVALAPDGTKTGYNTDCIGFVRAMEAEGVSLSGSVCVLGAGGAGRMFATECALRGCAVTLAVRENHLEDARKIVEHAAGLGCPGRISPCSIQSLSEGTGGLPQYDLLINATPSGMFPHIENTPIPQSVLSRVKTVFDCIYNPSRTRLMQEGEAVGCKVSGGMKMLVWQAAAAQEIWLGRRFSQEAVGRVIEKMERKGWGER